jgi:chromosomal replication initiator protein
MLELWSKALGELRSTTSRAIYDSWIEPMSLLGFEGDTLRLGVPDDRFLHYVAEHHVPRIVDSLASVSPRPWQVALEVIPADRDPELTGLSRSTQALSAAAREHGHATSEAPSAPTMSAPADHFVVEVATSPQAGAGAQTHLLSEQGRGQQRQSEAGGGLQPALSFDRFIVGAANELAAGAARAIATSDVAVFNPLFLHGGVGNGKTHLLNAIGLEIVRRRPGARVRYVAAAAFIDDVVSAMRSNQDAARARVRDRYRSVDILLVDDVQFLQGKTRTQEEFFHTFNALHQAGKQIVLTSDRYPTELESFQDRLRSRFEWGLVAEIAPPDEAMRLGVLHRKAAERNISLPHDVALFLAMRLRSSVRELEGAINRLDAYSRISRRAIDVDLAQSVLGPQAELCGHRYDVDAIMRATARHFSLKVSDLKGNRRHKHVTTARMIAMYLVRKHNETSYPELGRAFGGRDHSTAINACRRVAEWIHVNERIASDLASIESILGR